MAGSTNQPTACDQRIINPLDPVALVAPDKVQRELVNQVRFRGLRHRRGAVSRGERTVLRAIAAPGHIDEACELLKSAPFAA